ncbi:polyphosphate glucokinase [Allocatelliglobosispora scoriae]|uniref:Polyphosphate glucokinase n=1 Tax=Allocatelliglobosispora scoriae TaxID=643052 RepID=A0A841BLZ4_9ACTN|nr:ROK family protein [Allocatelliglobosispora scoriae]MBB5868276.1 polyphosphate glucokinase [Allocatelliglobosispora scoriae]
MRTMVFDCGGTALKAAVIGDRAEPSLQTVRIPTPYPLPPERLVGTLLEVARTLPSADRVTVGFPGMVRDGIVLNTPHYINPKGPGTAADPQLVQAWRRFDVAAAVGRAVELPTMALNDADMHGAAFARGDGLELTITLGTGLGFAIYHNGELMPHLEMSQAPFRFTTYDYYISDRALSRIGPRRWVRRVGRVLDALRPVVVWDRLFLGGGNARLFGADDVSRFGSDVTVVTNLDGMRGGHRVWERG